MEVARRKPSPPNSAAPHRAKASKPLASTSQTPSAEKDPLVSVIIPVYNVAKLLECCMESVLGQTYTHLEIILVDDGSTDMSGQFCNAYAKRDSRIHVIHQSNRGLSGARNSGLKIATGEYITFVDSDDSIHPCLIEVLLRLCQTSNTKMSICNFLEIPASSAAKTEAKTTKNRASTALQPSRTTSHSSLAAAVKTDYDTHSADNSTYNTLDTLTHMLCEDGFSMSAWAKLYARELFDTVTFPEGKLYEDVGTTYRLVLQCPEIAVTPARLYNYYITPGSITQQSFSLRKLDLIDLTDQMCDDLIQWGITQDSAAKLQLKNLTEKRRMHARFSVLRQMVMLSPSALQSASTHQSSIQVSPKSQSQSKNTQSSVQPISKPQPLDRQSFYAARRQVVTYLRRHKAFIKKNPLAARRDRLALLSLQLGLPVFKFSWQLYQSRRPSNK